MILNKKHLNLYSTIIFVIVLSTSFCYAQSSKKPNVIIIYTDDQGAVDLGSYGAKDIYSPNIDNLAKSGTKFTQSYVAAPVCAPSRAALLTGNYPQNAGVPSNTSASPGSKGLPAEQYTMAELFKDNGYATGHIGKWHLGMDIESSPNAQGFDYSFGHLRGCIDNYSHYFYWEGPNVHDLYENGKEVFYEGQYFPDLASEKAIDFVEEQKEQPFFMFYAINMPHYPYQPTQKWRDYYKDTPKPRGDYAAFISTIDERIGFLIDKLDDLGIRENTIIIYQSDNGYSTETRAFNGGGNSGPYRGAKSSLFEGGIRLPTIINWKNHLPENEVNNQFIMNIDWMPTLAKLCSLDTTLNAIDGLDISKMLKNPIVNSPRNSAFWKYGNQWVVRKGDWKLIGNPKDTSNKGKLDFNTDALFLVNLKIDNSEMKNLASEYPKIVEELLKDYISWEHGSINDIPKKIKKVSHLGTFGTITSTSKLHSNYKNIEVLLDGELGYADFSTGQWIGTEGSDLEFIIDLKHIQKISEINLNYLSSFGDWIFPPKNFEVSFSENGNEFNSKKIKDIEISKNNNNLNPATINLNLKARFIKVKIKGIGSCPDWHTGAGNPAWFFIDEIIIK
ncbi:sulfatase-like hydrolase/transferase [Lutibacter sp. A80]|uniref:sulfatase-like hydrolase/transferase n=1 Tax=Lutibacter sp. A80 TaxID=2918453 RepID=UPI001F064EDA|nr:sulfatase-like hydrolase/transferase [Lutibacter sp. A80]UMB61046.1 sulfatase-like hydrolase/transferase [Lutibacter sp. A80]